VTLGILTPRFESGNDTLKAGDLMLQDVDLMLSVIKAIDRKLHVAGLEPLQEWRSPASSSAAGDSSMTRRWFEARWIKNESAI
jgi:hypothetical protein